MSIELNNFFNIVDNVVLKYTNMKLAIAVSGGIDSTTLALLIDLWSKENKKYNIDITAIIVDHQLREESAEEAQNISFFLKQLNIKSFILKRNKNPLHTKIQEQARFDRYELLNKFCLENSIPYLFIAHHLDDDLETYMMRANKGENIVGLSGISIKTILQNTTILRPLLRYSKKEIINFFDTLIKNNKDLIAKDPSNFNAKFERVRARFALEKKTSTEKIKLQDTLNIEKENRAIFEANFMDFIVKECFINIFGVILINLENFLQNKESFKIYSLRILLKYVGGKEFLKINQINLALQNLYLYRKINIANCIVMIKTYNKIKYIKIYKESKVKDKEFLEINLDNYKKISFSSYIFINELINKQIFQSQYSITTVKNIRDNNIKNKINSYYKSYGISNNILMPILIDTNNNNLLFSDYNFNLICFKPQKTLYNKFFY
jgi:tRNA(Ile)-lysidine synthetase-like protein